MLNEPKEKLCPAILTTNQHTTLMIGFKIFKHSIKTLIFNIQCILTTKYAVIGTINLPYVVGGDLAFVFAIM